MKKPKATLLQIFCLIAFVGLGLYAVYCTDRGFTVADARALAGATMVVWLVYFCDLYCTRVRARSESRSTPRTFWDMYTTGQQVTLSEAFDLLYDFPGPHHWFAIRAGISSVYHGSSYLEAYNCLSDVCGFMDETGIPYCLIVVSNQTVKVLIFEVKVSHLPEDQVFLGEATLHAQHKSTQRQ